MSSDPEQIEGLIFLPNPQYPYPFEVTPPPHFWMTEQTGMLEAAVEAYFNGERLSAEHLGLLKLYLRQYIERAVLTGDANRAALLRRLDALKTTREIEQFADDIADVGIEPF
jgi:hypothetical protein